MSRLEKLKKTKKPATVAVVSAMLLLLMGAYATYLSYKIGWKEHERETVRTLQRLEEQVEHALSYCNSAALLLAYTVDDNGVATNFDSVAKSLMTAASYYDVLELQANGVITHIYPMTGNESAMGYDILQDPNRNKEALKAIERKHMYYAGPFELKQGGQAIVGRLPIFIDNNFWGFSAVIISLEKFLNNSGIDQVTGGKYHVQFAKINPNTGEEEFFLPRKEGYPNSASEKVVISQGGWVLYVDPVGGFTGWVFVIPMGILSMCLAIVGGFFINELLKRPRELERQLVEHSEELIKSERKFRSIFEQAAIGVAHVNVMTGHYLAVNQRFCEMLGYNEEEMMSLSFSQITHRDDLEESINNLMDLRNGDILEFSLEKRFIRKNGTQVWANVTVSPMWKQPELPSSYIAIVEDISEKKNFQERILESSLQAQEREKNRIARELHDGIVQELVACGIQAESLVNVLNSPPDLMERIAQLIATIKKVTNDTRGLSHNLLSADMNEMTLVDLLNRLEHQLKSLSAVDLRMEVHLECDDDLISKAVKINIYRAVQELTTNIIKHASATFAVISVEQIGDQIFVTVRDNGVGLKNEPREGIGWYNIKSRISKIGGRLEYNQPDSGGLEVSFHVPILEPAVYSTLHQPSSPNEARPLI
ncbi:PAS domain S-box protein [Marinoscillum furvescens]|uniref:histidine kinase n=1 Tax=Marinoscillum furvescens DSM 4134 TaxID=1122208 RepID=A0A3D9KZC7_MARFU|nr:PAS domain S-box protein [Marinoscillum furvescens]RED95642.1 PAS domain S-box-containing protein [Marinoscillum furvescens DSM 4134]